MFETSMGVEDWAWDLISEFIGLWHLTMMSLANKPISNEMDKMENQTNIVIVIFFVVNEFCSSVDIINVCLSLIWEQEQYSEPISQENGSLLADKTEIPDQPVDEAASVERYLPWALLLSNYLKCWSISLYCFCAWQG